MKSFIIFDKLAWRFPANFNATVTILPHILVTMFGNYFSFRNIDFKSVFKSGFVVFSMASALQYSTFISNVNASCSGVCSEDLQLLLEAEETTAQSDKNSKSSSGLSISVDGDPVLGKVTSEDKVIITDKNLSAVDIQIKFDGLEVVRRLNVATSELRRTYAPGETVDFHGSWNYPQFVERAELRIFKAGDKPSAVSVAQPIETIEIPVEGIERGKVSWNSFSSADDLDLYGSDLVYVLRVYDSKNRFDETNPVDLRLSQRRASIEELISERPIAPGEGQDSTGISNIPIHGGSITVFGKNVPAGYVVSVLGEDIAIDESQRFVVNRILPPGEHVVEVDVNNGIEDEGLQFERDINIPENEWFYVGLADVTIGKRLTSDSAFIQQAEPGEFEDVYTRGRMAFYVKGKIKGETIITAAFDTTETELEDLFDGLDRKDPRRLLRNLDPDAFYPVYGDDSTTYDDAPTSGKFYIRVERGKSNVLWGNFKTRINGTELARFERGLYGARAQLVSDSVTSHGQPVAQLEAFGAQPESLPQRDEFRATGGSAYFLRRQDVNRGSEQVYIERRNSVTGEVEDRQLLRPDQDYDFDYVQGVVLLRRALQSTIGTSAAVRENAIGDDQQYLVVVYEFTPSATDIDGYTYGGRGQTWLGDYVRVGVTGFQEETGIANQTLYGADILLRMSEKSYFEFEWAESNGDSFGNVTSTDGGFIFNSNSAIGVGRAQAYRGKVNLDLGEVTNGHAEGHIGGYYEHRDEGFNAPGRYTSVEERLMGAHASIKLSEDTKMLARYDQADRADGNNRQEGSLEVEHRFNEEYKASIGVTHSDYETGRGSATGFGQRTDLGARITRNINEYEQDYLFGQVTVDRDSTRKRNDRYGIGFKRQLTDKVDGELEVSYGTQGVGGLAALNYRPNADDRYYLGYRLDPDTTGSDLNSYDPFGRDFGSLIFGADKRINEQTTVFFEENYDFTGDQRSLTHVYGVTYTPDDRWTYRAGLEAGNIFDEDDGDFNRYALATEVSLRDEVQTGSVRFEARFEESESGTSRDRTTYLMGGHYGYNYDDDWRLLADVNAVLSQSNEGVIYDGDFIEGSFGFAYRPKDDDSLNALFRYTYLEDLPGSQQVNDQNEIGGPRQKSHILEGDFIYDINERLSVGAKYGYRMGQIATDRASDVFVDSSAHLGILRIDWHLVHKWDVLFEARMLDLPELEQTNTGFLAGAYYHLGENVKVGVGYNFSQFSDDLSDLTQDDEGVFFNIVGKL